MKKITSLLALAAITLSCSNDDNTPAALNGTWKLTSVIMPEEMAIDKNGDGIASTDFIAEYGYFNNTTLVFGENNTAIFNNQDPSENATPIPDNVTYTINNNSISFYYSTNTEAGTLCTTFQRSGNVLTTTLNTNAPYYIPIDGENAEYYSLFSRSTLVYTKQ